MKPVHRCTTVFTLLLILLMPSMGSLAQTIDATGLVPFGWKILAQAEGDLNKDGLDDLALVLASAAEEDDMNQDSPDRHLTVYFQQTDGLYRQVIEVDKAILCRLCGGVFGDPFESLTIERGALVIRHYGGSRDRWGYTHRFRWQDGGWYLIGRTQHYHDTLDRSAEIIDENLSTGKSIVERTDDAGNTTRQTLNPGRKALINLANFDISAEQ